MPIIASRRGFLAGLGAVLAAPAIISASDLRWISAAPDLIEFGFDSFDKFKPEYVDFQWFSDKIMGEQTDQYITAIENSWRPVAAALFDDRFVIKGKRIECGNCVLMERSKAIGDVVREQEKRKALELVDRWKDRYREFQMDIKDA
jgi:hypothetical protein